MEYENEIEEYLQSQIQDKRNINISPQVYHLQIWWEWGRQEEYLVNRAIQTESSSYMNELYVPIRK